jgi:hypothetical protein
VTRGLAPAAFGLVLAAGVCGCGNSNTLGNAPQSLSFSTDFVATHSGQPADVTQIKVAGFHCSQVGSTHQIIVTGLTGPIGTPTVPVSVILTSANGGAGTIEASGHAYRSSGAGTSNARGGAGTIVVSASNAAVNSVDFPVPGGDLFIDADLKCGSA